MKYLLACCLLLTALAQTTRAREQSEESSPRFASKDSTKVQKSPTGALLRSLVLPGWGQWYNDQKIKAGIVVAAQATLIGFRFYFHNQASQFEKGSPEYNFYLDRRNFMYWLMAGVVVLSMLDAYIDAHLYNFDTGPDLALRFGAWRDRGRPTGLVRVGLRASF